jgi:hypothetical protein
MHRIFRLILFAALVVGPAMSQSTPAASTPNAASGELITCPKPLPTADDYESLVARNVVIDPQSLALVAPLEDTFLLHSNPGATQVLYIDWDGHKKGGYKPWDMDGDPDTFSDTERTVVQQTWLSVSEDFRYDYSWAYGGAWADPDGDIAYVYPGDDTWLWIADSITHEVGHTLNLGHDGRAGHEYYTGHGTGETEWCPVMGWGA